MRRLRILIMVFCLTVSIPLAFVVWQTYQSLSQEEQAQLRFFSETLFDEMEKELAELVRREESRTVDEYQFTRADGPGSTRKSPLARPPEPSYIIGYLQNNPDGSFQSPLVEDMGRVPLSMRDTVLQLKETNNIFNSKKFALAQKPAAPENKKLNNKKIDPPKKSKAVFADRYISKQQPSAKKNYLGSKSIRREKISQRQALNISKEESRLSSSWKDQEAAATSARGATAMTPAPLAEEAAEDLADKGAVSVGAITDSKDDLDFQVEVAPLQSVFIRDDRFFIFRRIAINNQIYRQGFLLEAGLFLNHLMAAHFNTQPMARFSELRLQVMENGGDTITVRSGQPAPQAEVVTRRRFPAPFDFLSATLAAASAPPSPARKPLGFALGVLGLFTLAGLAAIYQSVRTVVDLSERRSQFVSSVTHELKTPLTNIRMYIEMLEQGIAPNRDKEQDYLSILGSESSRLSRLINNVLELAKLEKKQRHFDMQEGQLKEVLTEVRTVMAQKLQQEGFELEFDHDPVPVFRFDREVVIQVLINLIENSVKFGRKRPEKRITIHTGMRDKWVCVAVSDTGPGIPRRALKKIFDDFYRVDNNLTRTTGGTGIGLALVKKFITAMGGRVEAVNNSGSGCTITLLLPRK